MKFKYMKTELGIVAPLVDRRRSELTAKLQVAEARTMSGSEVRKARRPLADTTSRKIKSGFVRAAVYFCAGLTLTVLIFMIAYILVKGVPFLRRDLFSWRYTSGNCSVMPALVNTLLMTIISPEIKQRIPKVINHRQSRWLEK